MSLVASFSFICPRGTSSAQFDKHPVTVPTPGRSGATCWKDPTAAPYRQPRHVRRCSRPRCLTENCPLDKLKSPAYGRAQGGALVSASATVAPLADAIVHAPLLTVMCCPDHPGAGPTAGVAQPCHRPSALTPRYHGWPRVAGCGPGAPELSAMTVATDRGDPARHG